MTNTSTQNPALQNMQAADLLLRTGLAFCKRLPGIVQGTALPGNTVRVPLDRTGIVTGVTLFITVPLDITAAATQSPFGPYNIVSDVQYVDFANVKHVDCTGWQLHFINAIKARRALAQSAKNAGYITGSETGIDTNLLALPTAVANANAYFTLYVPLAIDARSDLRGSILAQTDRGDHYLNLSFCNNLVGADPYLSPYTAGTVAMQAGKDITVDVFQHYIMPQGDILNTPLPMIDLSTVYELKGNISDSSNINAGQNKYLNWDNNRAVMSATHFFDQAGAGGTLNGADVSRIVLLVNGNTYVKDYTPQMMRLMQRDMLGYDMPSGVYYFGARHQPVTTQLYGNVQSVFSISTAGAGSYFSTMFESTYLSGTPLPGVIQA